jgi:hypothetical protein
MVIISSFRSCCCSSCGQKLYLVVHLVLRRCSLPHGPFAKLNQGVAARIFHQFKVGCVDLGVTVEAPEMLINGGRVQENGQPAGQRLGQPAPVFMEQVEVVLQTQHRRIAQGAGSTTPAIMRRFSSFDEKRRTTQ